MNLARCLQSRRYNELRWLVVALVVARVLLLATEAADSNASSSM